MTMTRLFPSIWSFLTNTWIMLQWWCWVADPTLIWRNPNCSLFKLGFNFRSSPTYTRKYQQNWPLCCWVKRVRVGHLLSYPTSDVRLVWSRRAPDLSSSILLLHILSCRGASGDIFLAFSGTENSSILNGFFHGFKACFLMGFWNPVVSFSHLQTCRGSEPSGKLLSMQQKKVAFNHKTKKERNFIWF